MGHRPGDALVEIWNGMPFFSPLWYRGPRIVFLHHVHAEMWGMVLPADAGPPGRIWPSSGSRPRFYRSSRIVTLSNSSRDEIVDLLGHRGRARVTVAPPGVGRPLHAGGQRSAAPLVVAVGRLVPVKRFDVLLARPGGGQAGPARPAGGHHRRGLRASRPRGAAAPERAPPTGSACPAGSTTTSSWPGTGRPGSWPAARSARGGA